MRPFILFFFFAMAGAFSAPPPPAPTPGGGKGSQPARPNSFVPPKPGNAGVPGRPGGGGVPGRPPISMRPSGAPNAPTAGSGALPMPGKDVGVTKFKIQIGAVIPEFPVYSYTPGARDPFISPEAIDNLVKHRKVVEVAENPDTLDMLLERLGKELKGATKVLGVSLNIGQKSAYALVQFSTQIFGVEGPTDPGALPPGVAPAAPPPAATKASQAALPPPISISQSDGFPVRTPSGDTSYVARLAAKIAIESGTRLIRDTSKNIIYIPIQQITENGILIAPTAKAKPILLENKVINFDDVLAEYEKNADQQSGPLQKSPP